MIYVVIISLVVHCAYYVFIFSKLALYNEQTIDSNVKKKVSILICYHNEEGNVGRHLPGILRQDVDEIILVDDNSSDDTPNLLNKHKTDKVKILSVEHSSLGKKQALSKGILSTQNNTILLTDADCKPASKNWSYHMTNKSTGFVLGYGPMNRKNGWVGLFSRFETYMTALQYLSYALVGLPYMGVGRNLVIDKMVVRSQKNKIKGAQLASGDDDLMINALANRENTSICLHPESFVYSDPKTSLKAFFRQKARHISTSTYYKSVHKILLGLFSASHILFYTLLTLGLFAGTISYKTGLLLLLVKWVIQQVINYPAMKKLREEDLFWKFPFLDLLFFVYLLSMPIYYLFNKNNPRWS